MDVTNGGIRRLSAGLLLLVLAMSMLGASGCGCENVPEVLSEYLPQSEASVLSVSVQTLRALPDEDQDGIPDRVDDNPTNGDVDQDGVLDGYEPDWNADEMLSRIEASLGDSVGTDCDEDGIPDFLDPSAFNSDANGDAVLDGLQTDSDGDGLFDWWDPYPGNEDVDNNGVLDALDDDSDADGLPDICDAAVLNPDVNQNGVKDGIDPASTNRVSFLRGRDGEVSHTDPNDL